MPVPGSSLNSKTLSKLAHMLPQSRQWDICIPVYRFVGSVSLDYGVQCVMGSHLDQVQAYIVWTTVALSKHQYFLLLVEQTSVRVHGG